MNIDGEKIFKLFCLTLFITIGVYFFSGKTIPNIVYSDMPTRIETHFRNKDVKREANKMDAKIELQKILGDIKKDDGEISPKEINRRIEEYGYRKYNGIYCYAIEDEEENWYIGMSYGESYKILESANYARTFNYYVNKKTLKIVD